MLVSTNNILSAFYLPLTLSLSRGTSNFWTNLGYLGWLPSIHVNLNLGQGKFPQYSFPCRVYGACLTAKEGPFASWSSCDAQSDRVLLRMTKSKPHEVASEIFQVLLHDANKPIGIDRTLRPTGSTTTHSSAIGAKEADKAWQPLHLPGGRSRGGLSSNSVQIQLKLSSDWLQIHFSLKVPIPILEGVNFML